MEWQLEVKAPFSRLFLKESRHESKAEAEANAKGWKLGGCETRVVELPTNETIEGADD